MKNPLIKIKSMEHNIHDGLNIVPEKPIGIDFTPDQVI